jgi:hypothetical protein
MLLAFGVKAQALAPKLKELTVSLWPEYDRPDVLVIYRAQLSADTSLPTPVTFRLPGYIEDMNAVAVEQDGQLININPDTIRLQHEGNDLWLTFPASSPNLHLEYYDPVILTKQNQIRQLAYDFLSHYDIEMTNFEVQRPFDAEEFLLTPEPIRTLTGQDNLQYSTIQVANLAADETFELSATYQRQTDEFSVQALMDSSPGQPVVITEPSVLLNNDKLNLGYILVGAGLVLLLGTGGYWWMKQRDIGTGLRSRPPQKYNQRTKVRRRKKSPVRQRMDKQRAASPATEEPSVRAGSSFCYQCGAALYPDAQFCHLCGAKRRTD